ncbi:YdcH family protein [Alteromonas facilis]|uniref:YdcH family protein n=1 Tax=Alteromonas facilis TaxID=2048004 RepID=UPI000C28E58E|nr:YdcH family protein [Alteromonas facilis]
MSLEKHNLLKEFPDHHHTIRHLKMNDTHFAKLFDEYHDIDHEVFQIEAGDKATSDEYLEQQKLKRVELKDVLFKLVKQEEAAQ